MGYTQLVIDPTEVPCETHEAFMNWYNSDFDQQPTVASPSECTAAIAAFYNEITTSMPDLNGPGFDEDDEDDAAEYDLRATSVYLECSWMPGAQELAPALALKHHLAYVDISADSTIYLPDGTTLHPN